MLRSAIPRSGVGDGDEQKIVIGPEERVEESHPAGRGKYTETETGQLHEIPSMNRKLQDTP
jgi:hypothetical protein